jgi:hypothetical protein
MRFSLRAFVLVSALALSSASFADSFSGSAVFNDTNNPNTNDVVFTGSFASPTFSFTAGAGSVFSNFLTITATTTQGGNGTISGTDNLSVVLSFILPDVSTGSLNGTGTITGHVNNAAGTISWNDTTITFSDGSSLLAHIPDFTFSSVNLSNGGKATTGGNLDLTVMADQTTRNIDTATAPEPSSIALMGTGVLAAASALRKRFAA